MQPTQYPQVNQLLEILLSSLRVVLDEKLIGLYLDGSLVWGDFDPNISDIDLLAAISSNIDDREFDALKEMHASLASEHKEWDDRIEVCYIQVDALRTVRTRTSQIVNISPGEPFHRMESSPEWLMNWYLAREKSRTLFGPDPKTLIEPISKEEFVQCAKDHVRSWGVWIKESPKNAFALSYIRLSLCRAMFVCARGDQLSKKQAALWVQKTYPGLSGLVQEALFWRAGPKHSPPDETAYANTVRFVEEVQRLILGGDKDPSGY